MMPDKNCLRSKVFSNFATRGTIDSVDFGDSEQKLNAPKINEIRSLDLVPAEWQLAGITAGGEKGSRS
jgi:hypothetical protein